MDRVEVALQAARLGEAPVAQGAIVCAHVEVLSNVDDDACALPALVVAVAHAALVELVDLLAAKHPHAVFRVGVRWKRAQTAIHMSLEFSFRDCLALII